MAEGRTNVGIARRLWLSDRTVETHVASVMAKLGLPTEDEAHRRVLAVLAYLSVYGDPTHRVVRSSGRTTPTVRSTFAYAACSPVAMTSASVSAFVAS